MRGSGGGGGGGAKILPKSVPKFIYGNFFFNLKELFENVVIFLFDLQDMGAPSSCHQTVRAVEGAGIGGATILQYSTVQYSS